MFLLALGAYGQGEAEDVPMPLPKPSNPGIRAVTTDGKEVILKGDNTWEYATPVAGDPAHSAVLTVTHVREMDDACGLQFRLLNNFGSRISTLVPRLGVYNSEGVHYDTASLSFTNIKPTKTQYTKVQFNGIGCRDISTIRVLDAGHCKMGNIDMFNEEDGQCLSHVFVEPSDLISITK